MARQEQQRRALNPLVFAERSGRLELGDFDLVYGYPWSGEAAMMRDIMERCGADGARLMINGGREGVHVFTITNGNSRQAAGTS